MFTMSNRTQKYIYTMDCPNFLRIRMQSTNCEPYKRIIIVIHAVLLFASERTKVTLRNTRRLLLF